MHKHLALPLEATLPRYETAAELLEDLTLLHESLAENRGKRLAERFVDPLLLAVRTFGLHLQTLDIRQHAKVDAAAMKELKAGGDVSAQTREVMATFRAIAELKKNLPATIRTLRGVGRDGGGGCADGGGAGADGRREGRRRNERER